MIIKFCYNIDGSQQKSFQINVNIKYEDFPLLMTLRYYQKYHQDGAAYVYFGDIA